MEMNANFIAADEVRPAHNPQDSGQQTDGQNVLHLALNDPVIAAAEQMAVMIARGNALEDLEAKGASEEIYRKDEEDDLYLRTDALAEYIATQRPKTVEGAIVQLALATTFFDLVVDNELANHVQKRCKHSFNRLAYSAIDFLRSDADLGSLSAVFERFMGSHIDPWKTSDERLAIVADKDAGTL